jgi:hypothetical protein
LRRLLINHHVFIADYPRAVGQYYLSNMLFRGFWPIGRFDTSQGIRFGLLKWTLKLIYFGWFAYVGTELMVRGLLSRPLHEIPWGGSAVNDMKVLKDPVRPGP